MSRAALFATADGAIPAILFAAHGYEENLQDLGSGFWPSDLKPPVPVTNLALFGYDVDVKTSKLNFLRPQRSRGGIPHNVFFTELVSFLRRAADRPS